MDFDPRRDSAIKKAGFRLVEVPCYQRQNVFPHVERLLGLLRRAPYLRMTPFGAIRQGSPRSKKTRDLISAACAVAGLGQFMRHDWQKAAAALGIPEEAGRLILRIADDARKLPYAAEIRAALLEACRVAEPEPPSKKKDKGEQTNVRPDTRRSPLGLGDAYGEP